MMKKTFSLRSCIFAVFILLSCLATAQASIVIRALVVNSSDISQRKIPFKSYLPKEIKPENIIEMGDLELAYDPQEGAYFVHQEYDLGPKETVTIEIELEDVWTIPVEDINSLRDAANELVTALANTDYAERGNYLKNSIESKLNQVEHSQTVKNPNPGGYISDYRENLKILEQVRADLSAAKSLVVEAQAIEPMLTWKLIVAIVVFLGVLGIIFFVIWQRQIKSLSELTEDYAGGVEEAPAVKEVTTEEAEVRKAEGEKKADVLDIEERLKKQSGE